MLKKHKVTNTKPIENINQRLIWKESDISDSLLIVVDKRTGVEYIVSVTGGICVMVDQNGKPLVDEKINTISAGECKNCNSYMSWGECLETGVKMEPNDFCSYWKRRNEHE